MAIRFGVSSTVKNRLPRYSNFWDGTAVFSPFTPTGSYDALASYTVPSGGVSQIEFAGIPTGGQYQHLQIRYIGRSSLSATGFPSLDIRLNSSSSSYAYHRLYGNGSSAVADSGTSLSSAIIGAVSAANNIADSFGAGVIDILDYTSTSKNKTIRCLTGGDNNGSGAIYLNSGLWFATPTAVTSIAFLLGAGQNFVQHSQFALYGIRG